MTFTLRDVPLSERPRERLMRHGASALSLAELVAILLGSGSASQPVMRTAQALVKRFSGGLEELSEATIEDLQELKSIGPAKACLLLACFELGRRISLESKHERVINAPSDAAVAARAGIRDFNKEHSLVLSLDSRNRLIKSDEVSVGILNASLVHPREVFGIAIKRHAAYIMLCHNHPSGDTEPSSDDIELTQRIMAAGEIIGIPLIDHVIVAKRKHYSFRESGLL